MEQEEVEHKPAGERVLDVLVFAPVGLVISAVEELPALAERGRTLLNGRLGSARAVGMFAVSAGRQELHRRSENLLRQHSVSTESRSASKPTTPGTPATRLSPDVAQQTGGGPEEQKQRREGPEEQREDPGEGPLTLAIPGFDALSASQVVQRLDGLTHEELHAVRAYEAAHRGRRTILNRVDQLLDERS